MGLDARKPVFGGFANNTDQPAHPCSLISAFVIRLLESISRLAMSEISSFSVAGQAGLNLTLSETLKTGFLASWPM